MSVFPFLSYMSMLVHIVLVVGTNDCIQTNHGDVVHCCTKFSCVSRILLLSMSLDSILVSNVVSVSGPYTELHERVYLHCSCFGT